MGELFQNAIRAARKALVYLEFGIFFLTLPLAALVTMLLCLALLPRNENGFLLFFPVTV